MGDHQRRNNRNSRHGGPDGKVYEVDRESYLSFCAAIGWDVPEPASLTSGHRSDKKTGGHSARDLPLQLTGGHHHHLLTPALRFWYAAWQYPPLTLVKLKQDDSHRQDQLQTQS